MTRKRFTIGIDPDLTKSGLAIWDNESVKWRFAESIENYLIPTVLGSIDPAESIVYMEAGWLNKKSNFRGGKRGISEAIARKVGQNQGVGIMLTQTLQAKGFKVLEIAPLKKGIFKRSGVWTVPGRKYIQDATGITTRINDEVRDACFIVLRFRP